MTINLLGRWGLTRVFIRDLLNRTIGFGLLFLMMFRLGHLLGLMGWAAALFIDVGPGIIMGTVARYWHWRWPLLTSLQSVSAVRFVGLGSMAFIHNPWALAAVYFVTSSASHLGAPMRSTWISLIVEPTQYERVSGFLESSIAVASVIGPSLAGLSWTILGRQTSMFVLMTMSLIGMVVVWRLPNPRVAAPPQSVSGSRDMVPAWLRRVLLVALLGSVSGGIVTVLLVPLVTTHAHVPPSSAGYADALMGLGAIAGSMVVVAAPRRLAHRRTLLPALGMGAVVIGLIPLIPNFYGIGSAMGLIGLVEGLVMGVVPSLFMRLPAEVRMQGFANLQLMSYGGMAAGSVLALVDRWIGVTDTILVAATVFALSSAVFPALPQTYRGNMEVSRSTDAPSPS